MTALTGRLSVEHTGDRIWISAADCCTWRMRSILPGNDTTKSSRWTATAAGSDVLRKLVKMDGLMRIAPFLDEVSIPARHPAPRLAAGRGRGRSASWARRSGERLSVLFTLVRLGPTAVRKDKARAAAEKALRLDSASLRW